MTARRLLLAASLAVAASLLVAPLAVGAQEDGPPTITLDATGAKAGQKVTVRGDGWSGSDLVYMELCGNAGRNGTRSCDPGNGVLTGVGPDGSFGAILTVGEPPMPCPCVVKATSQATQTSATAPLALQGVPVVALENQTEMSLLERSVAITEASFDGSGPWAAWFGGGAERTLTVTVENTGDVVVTDPPLSILAGRGANPTGVVPAPRLGIIQPGGSSTVEVPVAFDTMSFGKQTALVSVAGFAEPVEARATTTTYPWGLIAIAIVVAQLVLLRLRNRTRDKAELAAAPTSVDARRELERVPAMAAIGRGPRALPPGPPAQEDPADLLPPVPDDLLVGAAIAMPPGATGDIDETDDELIVIDLRDDPEPEHGTDPPEPPDEELLPNPFDYVSDETVALAVAAASRPVDRRTAKDRRDDERRAAEASVQAAKAEAASIVSAATEQAATVEAEAAAKRAATVSMIERSTRGVEELLQAAAEKADEIRRQAEKARCESVRAAAARLDAAYQAPAAAARASNSRGPSAPAILDLRDTPRVTRGTGTGGLASAIERAVHKAFKG